MNDDVHMSRFLVLCSCLLNEANMALLSLDISDYLRLYFTTDNSVTMKICHRSMRFCPNTELCIHMPIILKYTFNKPKTVFRSAHRRVKRSTVIGVRSNIV